MQDHNGDATCNSDITHVVQNPCPTPVIEQMIREGTAGTNSGDGLANCINQAGWANDADFYRAARIYNSGSIDGSGRLEAGIAVSPVDPVKLSHWQHCTYILTETFVSYDWQPVANLLTDPLLRIGHR